MNIEMYSHTVWFETSRTSAQYLHSKKNQRHHCLKVNMQAAAIVTLSRHILCSENQSSKLACSHRPNVHLHFASLHVVATLLQQDQAQKSAAAVSRQTCSATVNETRRIAYG
jgi:hypothetical protein